jgi:sulfite dehydrogenase (cytochrome) subunit B
MNRAQICWLAAAVGLVASLLTAGAQGDESGVRLARDPGSDLVRARCAICHSLDYIPMNSPFLTRTGWEAEVRKMIKVMGAPVDEPEVAPIVDYLAAHYGAE